MHTKTQETTKEIQTSETVQTVEISVPNFKKDELIAQLREQDIPFLATEDVF